MKKSASVSLIVLAVIVIIGFVVANSGEITGNAARVENVRGTRACVDSDGDLDLEDQKYVGGESRREGIVTDNIFKEKTDTCIRGDGAVREWYCPEGTSGSKGKLKKTILNCENGCVEDEKGIGVCYRPEGQVIADEKNDKISSLESQIGSLIDELCVLDSGSRFC